MSDRATPVRGPRRLLLAVAALLVAVAVSACGSATTTDPTPASSAATPAVFEVVVPEGTYADPDAQVLDALDQRVEDGRRILEFSVGDRLRVVNNDVMPHAIGFVSARPGETVEHVFTVTGEFVGACTMLGGEEIVVEVIAG